MSSNKIKGCIFDLDGTLLDTVGNINAAVNRIMEAYSRPAIANDAVFASYLGHGMRTLLDKCFGYKLSDDEYSVIGPEFLASYASDKVSSTVPYGGIEKLLKDLVNEGKNVAVISNKKDVLTVSIVEHFFSHIPFTLVMGQRDDFPLKPDPSSALYAASLMGLEPSEVAFVGDSFQDALTANNAGMVACSVLWGYQRIEEISSKASPDMVFERVEDLSRFLLD